jgi:hypothetical protein
MSAKGIIMESPKSPKGGSVGRAAEELMPSSERADLARVRDKMRGFEGLPEEEADLRLDQFLKSDPAARRAVITWGKTIDKLVEGGQG